MSYLAHIRANNPSAELFLAIRLGFTRCYFRISLISCNFYCYSPEFYRIKTNVHKIKQTVVTK
jgi:hypothetical protein